MTNPYQFLPASSFWRKAVSDKNFLEISDLWTSKYSISFADKIITAGSCFAQHISNAMREAGYRWVNYEQGPDFLLPEQLKLLNYGIYSFRTGNIYTVRALRQWIGWAFEEGTPFSEEVWISDRSYDPFRPAIEPNGFSNALEVVASRRTTLRAVRQAFEDADVFIFTLGLTEGWENINTSEIYPMAPGTAAGLFDTNQHRFVNFSYPSIYADMEWIVNFLKNINPSLRLILTVSPVPLTATYSKQHVLNSTIYSKSTLRAVAGDLSDKYHNIDYFPSYEIISAFPYRGSFFMPNMREVSKAGVAHVMSHFMRGISKEPTANKSAAPQLNNPSDLTTEDYLVCEERILQDYAN